MIRRPISRRAALMGMGAVGLSFTLPKQGFAASGKVNFYNWDTYIGETTLDDFTAATGIEVQYDLFADNDELFAKLKNGNPGYDLIVPTNDYVERMIVADMLVPLDHALIPNIANIGEGFRDPAFDPGRKYSMPYMWGSIGIGYRKSAVDSPPDSWADLYTSDKYAGRLSMLADGQHVFGMALKLMGESLNDWSPENLKAAEEMVIAQKDRITAFAPDNGQDLLLAGEVDLAMEWNGDILQVMDEDDDIGYVIPKEGGMIWEDTLCIPTGGPNPEGAHALINFLLDAEVGKDIAEFIYFATPNAAARALTEESYRDNPAIFPPEDAVANSETAVYPGQDAVQRIDEAWTRVKAAG
ncbi:spermidine/putrescine ABC transporter substrate-binding protein [Pikeienuella piscinae]|uniref:Putrescine-binding periplasmic protein n=1 Tax=Pikeienuella piscinae TaxID=2748098 RepID=A0A7L5BTF9_9RHOB|nr:spermidine/putrescine ABC transporter substrate-binding protein [Pikeienuella piscinae]QIE54023.1 spermidine/putrescine ABC transporter substrate-binding protein [Pikeienuella piscinae]